MNSEQYTSRSHRTTFKPKKSHSTLKTVLTTLGVLLAVIAIALGALGFKVYSDAKTAVNAAQDPKASSISVTTADFANKDPFTTLIVGTDTVAGQKVATTIVLAAINPTTKKTTFLNIAPDIIMSDEKTTFAQFYREQGLQATINKLQSLFNVKINKYALLDMNMLGSLTQATGGVAVENATTFSADGYSFNVGTLNLKTTAKTNAYLDYRETDTEDSFLTRQQGVGMALLDNLKQPKILVTHYSAILDTLSANVKTNITFADSRTIARNYYQALQTTTKINLHTNTDKSTGGAIKSLNTTKAAKAGQTFNEALAN